MTWDYRVIRKRCEATGEHFYAIHEVFLDGEERIWACTEEPEYPIGESWDELKADMLMFIQAVLHPGGVIDYDTIPQGDAESPIADCFDKDGELVGDTISIEEALEGWGLKFSELNHNCEHCQHWSKSGFCFARPLGVRDAKFNSQKRYVKTEPTDWCSRFLGYE